MRRLNAGCGQDIRPSSDGWVNLDWAAIPGVDVRADVFHLPWPFADASFDEVFGAHLLEHVPHQLPGNTKDGFLLVMEEIWRILKPGGIVTIKVPHYRSSRAIEDPTHARLVHPRNFDYFCLDTEYGRKYGHYTTARYVQVSSRVTAWHTWGETWWRAGRSRTPMTGHLAVRVPFLRPFLSRGPAELTIVLRKTA